MSPMLTINNNNNNNTININHNFVNVKRWGTFLALQPCTLKAVRY